MTMKEPPALMSSGGGAVVKGACLKIGDRGFEPHSSLQVSKKNVSSQLTRNDSILSKTERDMAQ